MHESLLSRRLKLGTYAGIPLFVHWSFALSILWVVISTYTVGVIGVFYSIAQLLGIFFCVTLHEYGHCLAARRFGIGTADITLLPIGGVARLKEMPRIPWQELIVAIAGPAVNVVIAIGLGIVLQWTVGGSIFEAIRTYGQVFASEGIENQEVAHMTNGLMTQPSWLGFAILMFVVNTVLVIFNMIPAFPMDGGRVFRSILAMFMDYEKATSVAFKVGVGCAVLMLFLALQSYPPHLMPMFISAFIVYAGLAEYRQVRATETVRGLSVSDVMVPTTHSVSMDAPLEQVVAQIRSQPVPAIPVVSITGSVVGLLAMHDVLQELKRDPTSTRTAGQMVNHNVPLIAVREDKLLQDVIKKVDRDQRQLAVVNRQEQLVGILDLETMMLRAKFHRATIQRHPVEESPAAAHFDAVS